MSSATSVGVRRRRVVAGQSSESQIVLVKLIRRTWTGQNQLDFAQAAIGAEVVTSTLIQAPRAKLIPKDLYEPISDAIRRYETALQSFALAFPWCSELGLHAVPSRSMAAILAEFDAIDAALTAAVGHLIGSYDARVVEPAQRTFMPLLGRRAFLEKHGVAPTDNDADEVYSLGLAAFEEAFHGGPRPILPRTSEAVRGRFGATLREVPIDLSAIAPEELGMAAEQMADAPREQLASELLKAASALVDKRLASNRFHAAIQATTLCVNWPDLFDADLLTRIAAAGGALADLVRRGEARERSQALIDIWPEAERVALQIRLGDLAAALTRPEVASHARGAVRRAFRITE